MQALSILFGAILILTSINAMFLILGALFSSSVERTRTVIEDGQGRTFLLGVVNTLFFLALTIGSIALRGVFGDPLGVIPMLIGFAIIAWFVIGTTFGLTSLVGVLGERIYADRPEVHKVYLGGSTLVFAILVPYVGWYLLLPYTVIYSFGAFMSGIFRQRRSNKVVKAG